MEIETEVKAYKVTMQCEICKAGLMNNTGKGVTQIETSWEHKCSTCGVITWYNSCYPFTRHKEINLKNKP